MEWEGGRKNIIYIGIRCEKGGRRPTAPIPPYGLSVISIRAATQHPSGAGWHSMLAPSEHGPKDVPLQPITGHAVVDFEIAANSSDPRLRSP